MVSLYFGLPGCGKTTLLSKLALQAVKGKKYENVYSNVCLDMDGVINIDNSVIGRFDLHDGILLIDEATLFADSRDYKAFSKDLIEFFLKHRHHNIDIVLFTQQWDGIDRKIRVITTEVYYVYKNILSGHWISCYTRIPYGLAFPNPKTNGGEKYGDIAQGYCKPSLLSRIFAHRIYRPAYYKYFDSWERRKLPELPPQYKPHVRQKKPKRHNLIQGAKNIFAALREKFFAPKPPN